MYPSSFSSPYACRRPAESVRTPLRSPQEAVSVNKALQASKELISADLGRVSNDVEIYRELPNRNVEVMVCLSYSAKMALDVAKKNLAARMEDKTEELHRKLDRMMGLGRFEGDTNTNLRANAD